MSTTMNTHDRSDNSSAIPTTPSLRRRPLPSLPRNAPTESNLSSSPNLSSSSSTSPDSEALPRYPSLPPAYSALPIAILLENKKALHADSRPKSPGSSVPADTASSPPNSAPMSSSTFPSSSHATPSLPIAHSLPASPARFPLSPSRSLPASPALVPPTLTALAIPPSPALGRNGRKKTESALWSAEVQTSAVDAHPELLVQALTRIGPAPPSRIPTARPASRRNGASAPMIGLYNSDAVRARASSSAAVHAHSSSTRPPAARRSASSHHLKQRSDADAGLYNLPRAGNSFLTLASPDADDYTEGVQTSSLKQDVERMTQRHGRSHPRELGVDVETWLRQTATQGVHLVGGPSTPHPARVPSNAPEVPQVPSASRPRAISSTSRSARAPSTSRSAQAPSAYRSSHATHDADQAIPRNAHAERPHPHQRAHTLDHVPHSSRSEPDLLALLKTKHCRSTSERLIPAERPPMPSSAPPNRPPMPSSPPARRDSLATPPPPRTPTPTLLRTLTSRAKQAFNPKFTGRARTGSSGDISIPPTPPLPARTGV